MKRISLILVLMAWAAMVSMAVAQTHYEGSIAVGGKGGMTLSRVNFNPSVEQSMLPGAMMGVMFRYIEEKNFGLIAELNMEQRGWKEAYDDKSMSFHHRFTYIQLPVLTHITFGSNRVKGFFNAGPEIGLMIADGVKSNFDYKNAADMEYFLNDTRHIEQFTMDVENRMDYGISAGMGMEVYIAPKHSLLLEGRFYYGLGDAFSNHKTDIFSSSNSMSIMVTLGYFYRLK